MGWASKRRPQRRPSHLSQASCVIVSGFTAALDLDTYPLRNLIRPRCAEQTKPGRGKPVLIMHIGFFACFHAISLERSHFSKIVSLVALKLLVSLISRLVASLTNKQKRDRQTDTQNTYCNPRCACAPRVNYSCIATSTVWSLWTNHYTPNYSYCISLVLRPFASSALLTFKLTRNQKSGG